MNRDDSLGESFIPLTPVNFFSLEFDCFYLPREFAGKKLNEPAYTLPDTSKLCLEEAFAKLSMGWNEEGLYFLCLVNTPFRDAFYPAINRGDSLELFIDTRAVKKTGFCDKFCHHFFFLPKEVDGMKAGEITRFRGDDSHEICNSKELHLESDIHKRGYSLKIFIPSYCLHGYDPVECDRLRFTYRINRCDGAPQHFSATSDEYAIEQYPSLWSRVALIHEDRPIRPTSKKRR